MATVLYFHDLINLKAGTFPTTEQHPAGDPNYKFPSADTLRIMDTTIGKAQIPAIGDTLASTASVEGFARYFCSPPLKGAYTFGGATDDLSISIAVTESNAAVNLNNMRINAYIWRPSTGVKIATLIDNVYGKTEPSASVETCWYQNITSASVTTQDKDVIICEIWFVHTQANATARQVTFFYDGAVSNSTNNAVVSNHAGYFLVQANLTFYTFNKKGAFFSFFNT